MARLFLLPTGLFFISLSAIHSHILSSPRHLNRGTWGSLDRCPNGSFVTGMQLKTEPDQGIFFDDSALNGIKFFCSPFHIQGDPTRLALTPTADVEITSTVHIFGGWGIFRKCSFQPGIATGFNTRFESYQGTGPDDTAANNIRLYCNGVPGQGYLEGDGMTDGSWQASPLHCPTRMAFCGLKTQVYSGTSDNTAIDGVQILCCPIPNPAVECVPNDRWELVIECDNLEGISPTICSYSKTVGTSYYPHSESYWEVINAYRNVGFNLESAYGPLSGNFGLNYGHSSETGLNWTSSTTDVWQEEVSITMSFEVPPRVQSQVFQVYGTCGIYGAKANRFKKITTEVTDGGLFTVNVTYFEGN